jgi:hypothetical protein
VIQYLRSRPPVVVRVQCDDCGELSGVIPVSATTEDDQALEACRGLRASGWTEKRRLSGRGGLSGGGYIATLCPRCSGFKAPSPQLGLKL